MRDLILRICDLTRKAVKRIGCWLRATADLFRYRMWLPHLYVDLPPEEVIIISTDKWSRVADGYEHGPGETVHPRAILVRSRCVRCGHEESCWYPDRDTYEQMEGE